MIEDWTWKKFSEGSETIVIDNQTPEIGKIIPIDFTPQ